MRLFGWMSLVLTLLLAACGGSSGDQADVTAAPPRSAQLSESMTGVEYQASQSAGWQAAAAGQPIAVGGAVRTDAQARAKLDLSDGTIVRLAPATVFQLTELSPAATDAVTRFRLEAGKVFAALGGSLGAGTFEIDTPNGVAAVRGSIMSAEFFPGDGRMIVTCLEGRCQIVAPNGATADLSDAQQSGIPAYGRDPGRTIDINTVQLQSWADEFPEAADLVRRITPGPPPTATPASAPAQ